MRNHSALALAAIASGIAVLSASTAHAVAIYGVTRDNTLFSFDSLTPGTLTSGIAITGLANNEVVRGIDIRPATGELYAVGSFGNLYTLNGATGEATFESKITVATLSGTDFGIDFNPVPDRLRITSNTGQNLRINVDTGAATVDSQLSYAAGGLTPNIIASAYTNSSVGGTAPTSTTLFNIDSGLDSLVIQNPPNAGTLTTVGVGLGVNIGAVGGLDILTTGTLQEAFAALTPVNGSITNFYTIDLSSGVASLVGQIDGGLFVNDIAVVANPSLIVPEPATLAGLGLAALTLVRRRKH